MALNKIGYTEGSGLNIASHSFSEGGNTVHCERTALATGIATLPGSPQVDTENTVSVFPADPIDITGLAVIGIKANFSGNNVETTIKLRFYDSADVLIAESSVYTILNTTVADDTRYLGTFLEFYNKFGACGLKISILTIPTNSGDVSFYVFGI